jgi:ATP-binding cassette, subfamily B (MDR/TAP), member 1
VNHFVLNFIYLFVGRFIASYIATVCISITATRITKAIRRAFLEHLLRMEIAHFDKAKNGSAAAQITTNANRINTGIAEKLIIIVQSSSTIITGFIVALAVQWKLALITMTIFPVMVIVMCIFIAIHSRVDTVLIKTFGEAVALAQEAFASIRTIHAFSAQSKILKKFDDYLIQCQDACWIMSPLFGMVFSVEYFCAFSGTALAFWQGHRMYVDGEITNVGIIFT